MANTKNTKNTKSQIAAPVDAVSIGDLFNSLKSNVKAHPKAALGTGLNAAGNVAGLLDNDKLLGQGAGTALGYFAPQILGAILKKPVTASPLMRANLAMGLGNLGALFDSLRAKKEQEESAGLVDPRSKQPSVYAKY